MFEQQPTFELLFEQLGLDSSDEAIETFIRNHQLPSDVLLQDAEFWSEGQRQFIKSHLGADDDWAIVVDELNQQLHLDSDPKI